MPSKVTILIAVHEAAQHVESKIKSLIAQTIINDCTIVLLHCQNHQNEIELFDAFATSRANVIRVFHRQHEWLYDSWNTGLLVTDSEYVTTYNMDDQWHPEFLQTTTSYLDANQQVGIVSTRILVTDQPNQVWPDWTNIAEIPFYPYPESTAGPSPVWRRSLHHSHGLFTSYRTIGDARIWEKWYAAGEQFAVIDVPFTLYYLNKTSLERRRDENGHSYRELDLIQDATKRCHPSDDNAGIERHIQPTG